MAQEINRGKAQLLFSRAAEKDFGFPRGYRKLYKRILFNVPSQVSLSLSVVCFLESSLVMFNSLLPSSTWLHVPLQGDKLALGVAFHGRDRALLG